MSEKDEISIGLKIEYLNGKAPVQGWGEIQGKRFYFWARHCTWTFAVAASEDVDPAEISSSAAGFFIQGSYMIGGREAASYMPLDEARKLILSSAEIFNKFEKSEN